MIFQWKMNEGLAINQRNTNFKIKIVVQNDVMIKIVMAATFEKPKAEVYKIQLLKDKVIPTLRFILTKFRGGMN